MNESIAPLVHVQHLTKIFHPMHLRLRSWPPVRRQAPVRALHDVSFQVHAGELLALLGTNGAGKTTLLRILATVVLPTSGAVCIGGIDVRTGASRVKSWVGWASADERSLYWRLTGRHNLDFFAALHGLDRAARSRRIGQLCDELGLDALDRRVGEYSSGMRQRLALARALLHDPPVVLLDEPTRSVDPLGTIQLHRLIREQLLGAHRRAVILATHNLSEADALADRVLVLHRGEVRMAASMDGLRADPTGHPLADVFTQLAAAAP